MDRVRGVSIKRERWGISKFWEIEKSLNELLLMKYEKVKWVMCFVCLVGVKFKRLGVWF